MNDEHIFALVETINGAYLHAIHQLTPDAAFIDDICHVILCPRNPIRFPARQYVSIGEYTTRDAVRDFAVSYYSGSGAIKEIPDEGKAAS